MTPLVTVVIPSMARPEQLKKCLAQLLTTAPDIEVIAVLLKDDLASRTVVEQFQIIDIVDQDPERYAIGAWNDGAAQAHGQFLVTGADDLWFYDGWYEAALEAMAKINNYGVVGLNTMDRFEGKLATHYMVSRSYATNELGGVLFIPDYKHFYSDNEITERAVRDGRYIWAEDAIAEHRHWEWDKAPKDHVYDRVDGFYEEDKETFNERQAAGFPNLYPASFGIIRDEPRGWGSIALGYRMYKTPEPEFVGSLVKLVGGGLRSGDRVFEPAIGVPGHVAANHLVRAFLATDADSMLFVDDDMVFEASALTLLRDNVDTFDYDVLSGFCTHRTIPPHAVVMRIMDPQPTLPESLLGEQYGTLKDIEDNAVIEVDATGLAFTLVKRHVFEAMLSEYGALYTSWFDWGAHTEGEDVRFSRRCRQYGFQLAVDTNVKIGHIGRYTFGWDDHQKWLIQEKSNG